MLFAARRFSFKTVCSDRPEERLVRVDAFNDVASVCPASVPLGDKALSAAASSRWTVVNGSRSARAACRGSSVA